MCNLLQSCREHKLFPSSSHKLLPHPLLSATIVWFFSGTLLPSTFSQPGLDGVDNYPALKPNLDCLELASCLSPCKSLGIKVSVRRS